MFLLLKRGSIRMGGPSTWGRGGTGVSMRVCQTPNDPSIIMSTCLMHVMECGGLGSYCTMPSSATQPMMGCTVRSGVQGGSRQ